MAIPAFPLISRLCYDLVVLEGEPSQSFVVVVFTLSSCSSPCSGLLENESKDVVDYSIQSSAKEFYYSTYSFILTTRVII